MSMNAFAVLAEPNRRQLLDALLQAPQAVNSLVEVVGLSQPVVSKHLRILRDADFVRVQPNGQQRIYHINPEPLKDLDAWLTPYREFWSDKLDALERHLDASGGD